jgi:uncharacterized protein YecT (DUF1311 family)
MVKNCRKQAYAPVLAVFGATLIAGIPSQSFGQSMNVEGGPCAKAGSTTDTVSCFNKEYRAADRDLNSLYGRIQKVLEADELAGLVRAERLWVQYRDATCSAERALYGGGTGGSPTQIACWAAETRARQASLLRSFGWRLEKRGG